MASQEDKIINKVKKLLNLANNAAASEGERDNAMRMAHNLLAKYNLEMAQVEAAQGQPTEPRGVLTAVFYGRPWARQVVNQAAKLFFCKYIYQSIPGEKNAQHMFVGKESNAQAAAELAAFLVNSIRKEAKATEMGRGNAYVRSFGLGASVSIGIRVNKIIKESAGMKADPNAGTALVLANVYQIEEQKNAVVLSQEFPKLGKGHTGKRDISAEGARAGQAFGQTVQLAIHKELK